MSGAGEASEELVVTTEGALGVIRLNRPKALNAITLTMVRRMSEALDRFEAASDIGLILLEGAGERGLCAGGDIRGLYESIRDGGDLGKTFWREEYILNARIAGLRKPYIAFMDGIVMGGGVGLSAHGRHRIVTERTQLAMPETGIGFFPDVGGTWLLAHAPGELGAYYGLTGQTMTGEDAIRCGFADTMVRSDQLGALRAVFSRLGPQATSGMVRGAIAHFAAAPAAAPIEAHKPVIDAAFAHDDVGEIFAALEHAADLVAGLEHARVDFAKTTLQHLQQKSPTSLKVTLRLLRAARASASLQECLIREYAAALEIFLNRDFPEGIRAAVVDKDRKPRWSPARLADVTPAMVDAYFAPRGADELTFPAAGAGA